MAKITSQPWIINGNFFHPCFFFQYFIAFDPFSSHESIFSQSQFVISQKNTPLLLRHPKQQRCNFPSNAAQVEENGHRVVPYLIHIVGRNSFHFAIVNARSALTRIYSTVETPLFYYFFFSRFIQYNYYSHCFHIYTESEARLSNTIMRGGTFQPWSCT